MGHFEVKTKQKRKYGGGGNLRKTEDNQLKATGQSFYKSLSNANYMHRQKNVKERER